MFKIITTALVFFAISTTAHADKIYAGSATGAYTNTFCPLVQDALKTEYFEYACAATKGTGENVELVLANPTHVGIGQLNIMATLEQSKLAKLKIVAPNVGFECLYGVTSDPQITSLSAISKRAPAALPSAKSGSTLTFEQLQALDDNLSSLRNITHYEDAMTALQAVASGDAVITSFVQFADTSNPTFQFANENGMTFIPMINRKILRQKANGIQLFEPKEVSVEPQGLISFVKREAPPTITTSCTQVVFFTGVSDGLAGVEKEDQDLIAATLEKVQPPSGGKWDDIFANVRNLTGDALEKIKNLN